MISHRRDHMDLPGSIKKTDHFIKWVDVLIMFEQSRVEALRYRDVFI